MRRNKEASELSISLQIVTSFVTARGEEKKKELVRDRAYVEALVEKRREIGVRKRGADARFGSMSMVGGHNKWSTCFINDAVIVLL